MGAPPECGYTANLIAASAELRDRLPGLWDDSVACSISMDNAGLEALCERRLQSGNHWGRSPEEADEIYHGGM